MCQIGDDGKDQVDWRGSFRLAPFLLLLLYPASPSLVLSSQEMRDLNVYRGTSLIRDTPLLGPYRRIIPEVL